MYYITVDLNSHLSLVFVTQLLCLCVAYEEHLRFVRLQGSGEPNQHSVIQAVPEYRLLQTPGARADASVWSDGSGNVWLFGGEGFNANTSVTRPQLLDDLWMLNSSRLEWLLVHDGQTSSTVQSYHLDSVTSSIITFPVPPPRRLAAFCGVPGIVLVMFGGIGSNGTSLSDTWVFVTSKGIWLPVLSHDPSVGLPSTSWTTRISWCHEDVMYIVGDSGRNGTKLWQFSLRTLKWISSRSISDETIPGLQYSDKNVITVVWNRTLYSYSWAASRSFSQVWTLSIDVKKWMTVPSDEFRSGRKVQPFMWPYFHSEPSPYEIKCGAEISFQNCDADVSLCGCFRIDFLDWQTSRVQTSSWFYNGNMYIFGGSSPGVSITNRLFNDLWVAQLHRDGHKSLSSEAVIALSISMTFVGCFVLVVAGFCVWRIYDYHWGRSKSRELRIRYTQLKNLSFYN